MALEVLYTEYYGNLLWHWLVSLGVILISVLVGKVLYWISTNIFKKLASKTETKLDNIIVDMAEEPLVFAITLAGAWYGLSLLTLQDHARVWIWNVFQVLIVINVAWLISRLFDSIFREYLVPLAEKSETDLDDQLLPIIRKGTKAIIWILAILVALNNAGYNIGALLAGLGIGGLALAMAAKDTVENVFGGFTIFTDQPFKLNDRIKIAGFDGFVKEIGMRSTRIQTIEGRIVTIPNSTFAHNPVENITWEPSRKISMKLGLIYDTTPKEMEKAMKILKEIVKKNKALEEDTKIAFEEFADSSMNILFIYFIKKGEDIMAAKTSVNMEILKQFKKEGLEFAYPTQVVYRVNMD